MNTSSKRLTAILAVAVLTMAAYFVWHKDQKPSPPPGAIQSEKPEKLTIAFSMSPAAAPLLLATEKKLWAEQSIDVDPKEIAVGRMCLDAVLGGTADIGTVAETPLVYAALHGAKFCVLCSFTTSSEHQRCLARTDRGITAPENLAGKKVAAYLGSASEFHMDTFLGAHHLQRDQIQVINLKPPEMVNAMVTGQVDAAFVWEPFASEIEQRLGASVVRFPASDYYTMTFNVVCRPDFATQHPELAAKTLRVLLKATEFMRQNRAESISTVADKLKIKQELLGRIWDGYHYDVRLDHTLLDAMTTQAAWVLQRDSTATAVKGSLLPFLCAKPLQELQPSAVSLPSETQSPAGTPR